jgi:uncharacterized protein (DUF885 family)
MTTRLAPAPKAWYWLPVTFTACSLLWTAPAACQEPNADPPTRASGIRPEASGADAPGADPAGQPGPAGSFADEPTGGPDWLSDLDPSAATLRSLIERYAEDRELLERFYDLETWPARARQGRAFSGRWLQRLRQLDFSRLAHDQQIDYVLLQNELRHRQRRRQQSERRHRAAAGLLPFAPTLVQLHAARRRIDEVDPAEAAGQLAAIREQIDTVRADLTERRIAASRLTAQHALQLLEELRDTLRRWHAFHSRYDPTFTWWVSQPYQQADDALGDYGTFLREELVGVKPDDTETILGQPIGREALLGELAYEMIDYSPEELIAIGRRELDWCHEQLRLAARELGYSDNWRQALDHVKNLHVAPGKQPELIKKLADEAVAFLEERQLVSIPDLCRRLWRMEMMSPERQRVNPYFTGGEVISVSFPTAEMRHADKLMSLRGNNIHFSRATVHHELIPGHHLQLFMADRYRTYRKVFRTPFLVEGWALYWEMLLWDLGFAQSPEDRVGMLFWRTHRCARIIFSLRYHLGEMSPEEAIDFLVENVGHERRNATAEVRRSVSGDYGPLYQAAYMLGGLQIRALRQQLVDTGQLTDRRFHDAILRENAIPIKLIRASLTGQYLSRDGAEPWRFYTLPSLAEDRDA